MRTADRGTQVCLAVGLLLATSVARANGDDVLAAIRRGDCAQAGAAINEGIERNEAEAYFGAGYLYASTGCVAEDLPRAARYYQRAIELGSSEARKMLGFMYGTGSGVPQDFREAYRWYTYRLGAAVAEPVDPGVEVALGYARTVQQLAANRVVYPRQFDRADEGTLYVTFHTATGELTYASQGSDGARNPQRLHRPSSFMASIDRAYAEAFRIVPRPDDLPKDDVEFEAPWTFELR